MASGSEQHHDEAPVIRVVKKKHHGGHHGGAWKVAYADFVTAMMALFIVLWILAQSEDMKKAVAGYFRHPAGKGEMSLGYKGGGPPKAEPLRNPAASNEVIDPLRALEEEAEQIRGVIEQQPDLKELAQQISIEVTPEGVRVEINENEQEPLFESGSSRLSAKLSDALRAFSVEFIKLGSPLVIEGHTDSQPFAQGSGKSNWELSTERASEARGIMVRAGLSEKQLFMIRGWADRKPRFEDPRDPRNRRISLLLLSPEGVKIALGQHGTNTPKSVDSATRASVSLPDPIPGLKRGGR